MEVSSHSIALKKVYPLKFKFGIFTNLSEEHLDFHKGIDDYYQTKLSLFHSCENGIFNLDNPYCMQAMMTLQNEINVHGIGIIKDADAMARDIIIDGFWGSKFIYREKKKIFKINLNLSGTYNIYNAMLAIKCALLSGVSPSTLKTSLKELASVDGRFEKVSQSPMVIIDYAHTEKALENLLIFVNSTKNAEQNICTVFGCGGERDRQKRPKMARIAQKYSDFVIVTTDNSRGEDASEIIREIELGFENSENHITIENRRRAIEFAVKNASEYDIVLIVGKGHERYNIDELGYHFFDERKIVKDALKEKERNQNNENRA